MQNDFALEAKVERIFSDSYSPLVITFSDANRSVGATIEFSDGRFIRTGEMSDHEAAELFVGDVKRFNGDIAFDFKPGTSSIEENHIAISRGAFGEFVRDASHPVEPAVWTLLEAISDRAISNAKH